MRSSKKVFSFIMFLGILFLMETGVFALEGQGSKTSPYIVTNYSELKGVMGESCYIKLGKSFVNTDTEAVTVAEGTEIDLDFNGYKISFSGYGSEISHAAIIIDGGCLSLRGSGGISIDSYSRIVGFTAKSGTLNINGGNFTSDFCVVFANEGSVVDINGGVFSPTDNQDITLIHAYNDSHVNIRGGTFNGKIDVYRDAFFVMEGGSVDTLYVEGSETPDNVLINEATIGKYIGFTSPTYGSSLSVESVLNVFSHFESKGVEYNTSSSYVDVKSSALSPFKVVKDKNYNSITSADVVIDKPKPGSYPDVAPDINTAGLELDEEMFYWKKDGQTMSESTAFEEGHSYALVMWLKAKDGYLLGTNSNFKPIVAAYINGQSATVYKAYDQNPYEVFELQFDFGTCQKTAITQIDVEIETPIAGNYPDFGPKVPEGCKFKNPNSPSLAGWYEGVRWRDATEGVYLDPTNKFAEGHDYELDLFIVPEDYATFNVGKVTINGEEVYFGTQNGVRAYHTFNARILGDVDKNGVVEVKDAALLLKYITGYEPALSQYQLDVAKVTDQSKDRPDIRDAIAIYNMATVG